MLAARRDSMKDLQDQVAFITGGAQGIGLGIARALAARGARLALADVDEAALSTAQAELTDLTPTNTFRLDVRDREAYARVADDVESGIGPVSLLFNNAGVASGVPPRQMSYEMWDWVLGVNLQGVVNGIQSFVPRMIDREQSGHVVNTASGAGLVAGGSGFLYTTSKFAVVGLSEALRIELAPHGIGVSVLCPGAVATGIVTHTASLTPGGPDVELPEVAAAMAAADAFLQRGTPADAVGTMVVDAIDADALYIHTDAALRDLIKARMDAILAALPEPAA
jgi:NAD(P)-dependent dehydrogenase (short-subunit alcohol dehydrogenase family)